jgi:hypothetical protein
LESLQTCGRKTDAAETFFLGERVTKRKRKGKKNKTLTHTKISNQDDSDASPWLHAGVLLVRITTPLFWLFFLQLKTAVFW